MKNPHRIKLISPAQMIGLALILAGAAGVLGFWLSKNYGIGKLRSDLEWCQQTLYDECGDLCNCDPPWYMSNLWMLEMQYETFGSIPIEVCNEEIDEIVDFYETRSGHEEWEETLSDCTLELQQCQWGLEECKESCDLKKVQEILEIKN